LNYPNRTRLKSTVGENAGEALIEIRKELFFSAPGCGRGWNCAARGWNLGFNLTN